MPATVQAVLAARIDRLGPEEKSVLQAAAVIGKEFPEPVLRGVAELAAPRLEEALRNLVAGEFVYEQEVYPEALYAFKHPLTQEVAYGSQLSGHRMAVHAAAARAIAERYPERLDERAALLAHHWEAAGEKLEAARWHARAGAWAGTGDPTQALRHWRRVCELVDTLTESAETIELGLAARFRWLQYGFRLGISHEEAEEMFDEAHRIAVNAGNIPAQAQLLVTYATVRGLNDGDTDEYARLFRQAVLLAEEAGDPELYVAVSPSSHSLFLIGEHRECVAVLDRAIELADGDPTMGADTTLRCPYAFFHTLKGLVRANQGELEEALHLLEHGRRLARDHGDIEVMGWNHMFTVWLAYFTGDPETALAQARQQLELADRIGDSFSRAWAWVHLGFAERLRGNWRPAIEALERSQAISRERRTAVEADAWRLAELAQAWLGAGDVERAREIASQRFELALPRPRGPFEIYANLGFARALLGCDGVGARVEIEALLATAAELARDTGAKAFEPLFHIELAELARQSGDRRRHERELLEAHRLFTDIGATGHVERLELELSTVGTG